MLISVILAGGSGTRLWPLSRETYPKQFIPLFHDASLFQKTLERTRQFPALGPTLIVGNEQHRFLMAEQIRKMGDQKVQIILEPSLKGTAPAAALAAVQAIAHHDNDVLLLILPADHHIENEAAFTQSIQHAIPAAQAGKLVAFGVKPTRPETGYGYIQTGEAFLDRSLVIDQFVEKPDTRNAERYLQSGSYWWNSGIYLFSAGAYLQALLLHAPETYHGARNAIAQAKRDMDFVRPDQAAFDKCLLDSIDYAVMEKTHQGVMVPLGCDWNDVGAWDALATLGKTDEHGNQVEGNVIAEKTERCLVHADKRLVVTLGVQDLIVVDTPDALLIMAKDAAQSLKSIVSDLKSQQCKQVIFHQRVNRPWGSFESVDEGERFQVKRITVDVGQRLSLQRHHHRSEHWVVVRGTARVTRVFSCITEGSRDKSKTFWAGPPPQ